MAELIARRWSLGVLRVTLDEAPQVPSITCEIVINDGEQRPVKLHRTFTVRDFGMGDSGAPSRRRELGLSIPEALVQDVADWVRGGADERAVLWVHLVKPYGVLGAVAWEDMQREIGIPILRLPDVLPDQQPPRGAIDIAVCAAALQMKGPLPIGEAAMEIMRLAGSLDRRVRVHYFVGDTLADELEHRVARSGSAVQVFIHRWDPSRDERGIVTRGTPGRADNRWLAWMQDAAREHSFDLVHFICHGYVTGEGDRGVLSLPISPSDADFEGASHVTAAEVLDFSATVGAFAVGFSSLSTNYSVSGMRLVADALGANRAGPVFMHDRGRGEADDLAYAYLLVLGQAPDWYPPDPALLFYAQPDLVHVDRNRALDLPDYGVVLESPAASSIEEVLPSVSGTLSDAPGEAPAWLTVLARYVDEKRGDLVSLMATQSPSSLPGSQAYMEGVQRALTHLDEVVVRHASGSS